MVSQAEVLSSSTGGPGERTQGLIGFGFVVSFCYAWRTFSTANFRLDFWLASTEYSRPAGAKFLGFQAPEILEPPGPEARSEALMDWRQNSLTTMKTQEKRRRSSQIGEKTPQSAQIARSTPGQRSPVHFLWLLETAAFMEACPDPVGRLQSG